jgi:hypothetical protein
VKPCNSCGHALGNGATSCSKCGAIWKNKVQVNPDLRPRGTAPRYNPWPDLILAIVMAAVGFYFFGILGALAGLALVAIITVSI